MSLWFIPVLNIVVAAVPSMVVLPAAVVVLAIDGAAGRNTDLIISLAADLTAIVTAGVAADLNDGATRGFVGVPGNALVFALAPCKCVCPCDSP